MAANKKSYDELSISEKIEAKKKKIKRLFREMPPEKRQFAEGLINQFAVTSVTLERLADEINNGDLCSLMFRFTACISSSVVVDSCQPLFTIIFLDLLLVLEVSGCFSYNGMGFRLQLPFRIFLCGYSKLFSINRTIYNNISFTHLLR